MRNALVNGCDPADLPAGYRMEQDDRPAAERMAAFDALPLRVRLACKYAPLDTVTLSMEEFVAKHGAMRAVPAILASMDSLWDAVGARPLKP